MNTKMLKLASAFSAVSDVGYFLESVYATPTCIVACDGRRIVKIDCDIELPDNMPLMLNITDVLRFVKSIPKKLQDKPVSIDKTASTTVKLESCGQSSIIQLIDGQYPDYNCVIPALDKRTCTGKWNNFNWTLLADAQKSYGEYVGKKDMSTLPFKMLENNAYFNDGDGVEIVIMPVKK